MAQPCVTSMGLRREEEKPWPFLGPICPREMLVPPLSMVDALCIHVPIAQMERAGPEDEWTLTRSKRARQQPQGLPMPMLPLYSQGQRGTAMCNGV